MYVFVLWVLFDAPEPSLTTLLVLLLWLVLVLVLLHSLRQHHEQLCWSGDRQGGADSIAAPSATAVIIVIIPSTVSKYIAAGAQASIPRATIPHQRHGCSPLGLAECKRREHHASAPEQHVGRVLQ